MERARPDTNATDAVAGGGAPSAGPSGDRRRRLLAQVEPSQAAGIGDALAIKDGPLYFLCARDGGVPCCEGHALGLYFRDCRYLSGCELRLAGERLEPLAHDDGDGFRALVQLTNPKLEHVEAPIPRQLIGVRWRHVVDAHDAALRDELMLENYDTRAHAFPLSLTFRADFRDVYVIRGLIDRAHGEVHEPRWIDGELVFAYDGRDGKRRELRVAISERPARRDGGRVELDLALGPREVRRIAFSFAVVEAGGPHASARDPRAGARRAESAFERSLDDWMEGFAVVRSSSGLLEDVVDRGLRDLRALRMSIEGHSFLAAGVPWFVTLFGRDSLVCALQTLAYRPQIAAATLRLLARFQGRAHDAARDEEPGKILHELRVGELASTGEIPHTPYYGTVDATPLFVVVLAEYVRWTGDLALAEELAEPVRAALRWTRELGDHDGDGFVDYHAEPGERLINQGWKDSGRAIVDGRGRTAEAPIALVEVQGYVHRALLDAAWLARLRGDEFAARELRREAFELAERFERDFWMADARFYALARLRGGRLADVVSSNPGHALWSGIVGARRAARVVERLMRPDMFNGWGVRTLSSEERAYNPVGYHLGTVWPHDNAILGAGFKRHGFDAAAVRVFDGLVHAASHFELRRLPEAFAGYDRREFGTPVSYPVACRPQAWAAGSVPYLLTALLGLEPDGLARRLRIVRPCLPREVEHVALEGMNVAGARLDLCFERARDGRLEARVEALDGDLEVEIEPGGCPASR